MNPRPEEKHPERQPGIDRKRGRAVGRSDDHRIAIVVEKFRVRGVTAVVRILAPRQGRAEQAERRDKRMRGTECRSLENAIPEPADGKTIARVTRTRPV